MPLKKHINTNNNNNKVSCFICGQEYKNNDNKFAQIQIDNPQYKNPIYLCSECISKLSIETGIIDNNNSNNISLSSNTITNNNMIVSYKNTSPKKIKEYLDQYIIGQEDAKKIISVAYYNHLKRISLSKKDKTKIKKSNILLVGPTGSGKTLIAQKLAEMSNVPFISVDATTFTKKGYIGDDVEDILVKLYKNSNGNKELTEKGIIYLDECDKLASRESNEVSTNYVGGEGVQQALLKMIEGNDINISKDKSQQSISIDTSNILFILGGAFSGIEKIYADRIKVKNNIGFNSEKNNSTNLLNKNIFQSLESNDFIKFGIIPELVGRLPIIAALNKLTEEELIDVLMKPKDSICNEYIELFKMDNMNICFSDDSLKYIANQAIKKNLGARGLRGVLESKLNNLMFDYSNVDSDVESITITETFLKDSKNNSLFIKYKNNDIKDKTQKNKYLKNNIRKKISKIITV